MLKLVKDKTINIALIGASNDRSKYGYKIYKNLTTKGYTVIPINPKEILIEEIKSLPRIESMDQIPDIIDFVVPPKVALAESKRLESKGYDNFWFQPGSESDELIEFLKSTKLNYLIDECIMVET